MGKCLESLHPAIRPGGSHDRGSPLRSPLSADLSDRSDEIRMFVKEGGIIFDQYKGFFSSLENGEDLICPFHLLYRYPVSIQHDAREDDRTISTDVEDVSGMPVKNTIERL